MLFLKKRACTCIRVYHLRTTLLCVHICIDLRSCILLKKFKRGQLYIPTYMMLCTYCK